MEGSSKEEPEGLQCLNEMRKASINDDEDQLLDEIASLHVHQTRGALIPDLFK